ncbi:MAG: 16S rRNA (cytidine(1402)-2'-O)-methyltransferase [Nitriliruptoraceae bacterium]
MTGILHVVATPIGNLDDLTLRAAEVLRTVDLVLSEDTRHTGRLLAHLGSEVPQLSLHEHNERERTGEVLDRLAAGQDLALVSDAGTPTVSDPGLRLVAAVGAAGGRVVPLPGASALLAALMVAGLPTDRVVFEGFLPRKGRARRDRLAALTTEPRTIVLFVSPHRGAQDLADLAATLGGDRAAVLARELTKLHEELRRGTLARLADEAATGLRGEVTLVVAGAPGPVTDDDPADALEAVAAAIAAGQSTRDAVAAVAEDQGMSRRALYQAVLDARPGGHGS